MENTRYTIPVITSRGRFFFQPEEIVRLEACSNYTFIYLVNKKKMLTTRLLKDYEEMLRPLGFVRTHRSHLVNKRYISYLNGEGGIWMQDESRAEISRRKKSRVLQALMAA